MSTRLTPQGTLYDVLEKKDWFKHNPANVSAVSREGVPIYSKQEFPMMVYHPEGATRIIEQAEMIATVFGPQRVGEKSEIIWQMANSQEELEALLAQGWHTRPSAAARVNPASVQGLVPPPSLEDQMEALRAENRRLQAAVTAAEED